jgi:hypothetical protein
MIKNFPVRMEEEIIFKMKKIAEKQNRSTNGQIVRILENYIKDFERINGKIGENTEKKEKENKEWEVL